jgi:hypothetical protein
MAGVGEVNDETNSRKDVITRKFSDVPGSYSSGITVLAATHLYFSSEPWWCSKLRCVRLEAFTVWLLWNESDAV